MPYYTQCPIFTHGKILHVFFRRLDRSEHFIIPETMYGTNCHYLLLEASTHIVCWIIIADWVFLLNSAALEIGSQLPRGSIWKLLVWLLKQRCHFQSLLMNYPDQQWMDAKMRRRQPINAPIGCWTQLKESRFEKQCVIHIISLQSLDHTRIPHGISPCT